MHTVKIRKKRRHGRNVPQNVRSQHAKDVPTGTNQTCSPHLVCLTNQQDTKRARLRWENTTRPQSTYVKTAPTIQLSSITSHVKIQQINGANVAFAKARYECTASPTSHHATTHTRYFSLKVSIHKRTKKENSVSVRINFSHSPALHSTNRTYRSIYLRESHLVRLEKQRNTHSNCLLH